MDDMEKYKQVCEGIPVKDEKSMTERVKAFVGLTSKLEALKNLAN
jgi:hypothetical protein